MASRIRVKPKQFWVDNNPTLKLGEQAIEAETGRTKFGDGVTPWYELDGFMPETKIRQLISEGGGGGGGSAELPPRLGAMTPVVSDANDISETGVVFVISFDPEGVTNLPNNEPASFVNNFSVVAEYEGTPFPVQQQLCVVSGHFYVRGYQSDDGWSVWTEITPSTI